MEENEKTLGEKVADIAVELDDIAKVIQLWAGISAVKVKESEFRLYQNLPGAEGIVFIGDELHILYESGALSNLDDFFNKLTWNQFLKDCTDVIWRLNENDLSQTAQSENTGLGHRIQSMLAKFLELVM